jgi:hypothetical protein
VWRPSGEGRTTLAWIIKSKDGENRYTTEAGFHAALKDPFGDPKNKFISAPYRTEQCSMRPPRNH